MTRNRWFEHDDDFSRQAGSRGRGRGPFGGGPPFGGPFGGGPGGGPPWGGGHPLQNWLGQMFGRGQRRRRGDIRFAILTLLSEGPHNGYQIMQAIEQRSHGTWKPSSGSIYPTLQQLEDEGLVAAVESATTQSRTFDLTKTGRAYVKEHEKELQTDWDLSDDDNPWADNPRFELFNLIRQLAMTVHQVAQAGSDKQLEEAKRVLADARRKLYSLLAEIGDDE
jgi:DNA-binding PadR family transcriptional regulator